MNIFFEKLLKEPHLVDRLSHEECIVLDEIYKYVEGRLMPFKEEMEVIEDAEAEALNQKGTKPESFVLICLPHNGIGVQGYTDELRVKMVNSFSQLDVDPIAQRMLESLKRILN